MNPHSRIYVPSAVQKMLREHLFTVTQDSQNLLLEALLWRGFLAFEDQEGVWLGSGSHQADIGVLQLIQGLEVTPVAQSPLKAASVRCAKDDLQRIAEDIIYLPQHRGFSGRGVIPGRRLENNWGHYAAMKWGAKRPVCPAQHLNDDYVYDALDAGIALLVKTLPLARVATSLSCDGHGSKPAYIRFHFPWDAIWCQMVFGSLNVPTPHSRWTWLVGEKERGPRLEISPTNDCLDMFCDIQMLGRRLLDQKLIDAIGMARQHVLAQFRHRRDVTLNEFIQKVEVIKPDIEKAVRTGA